ncbi:DUF1002 domain-containing protein [Aerococcus sanguinicola]|uniref:DUF1002 domain-containing protein n=1 Tax=Aerococcus sanguinicola TaxID=119206 RepID=A0A120I9B0_9LACT|nr:MULTISPECIES: DUF1002 domain-containing protein [Aerococcus]AMB94345.1 hypothetical protein AWM72_06020 [Aerococcus sanguinicola]MDK7049868.1 DUF1002 domain-containing protein [Aerococcus sanguinicola]OFT93488.1 hypothetical protein HMPREF3090_06945 [Aerococcus sp. HMSC23C02]PKZ22525.1 DUF1002 domain-containing protein [Aerococcus sanguinicola]
MKALLKKVALGASLAVLSLNLVPTVLADKIQINPMFTYGESLNQSQYQETKQALGVQDGAKEIQVNINELNGLLQDNYPYRQVYSSAYITPAKNNGDVTVEIVTPKTITAITPLQYENAALTAGAVDVDIKVASAVPVDGSGALAGVYKAFQDAGYQLNDQAVSVAQDELTTTSKINEENQGKEGFSDEAMNAAIAEIKTEIQKAKDENNGQIDSQQIQVIVNNIINNYNLNEVISEENKQSIINLMQQFSQIELTQEQKDAINQFGQDLLKNGDQIIQNAKSAWDNADKEQLAQDAQSIWDQIVAFVKSFFSNSEEAPASADQQN